jgi:predicted acylesterase/phospholipase RssA
MFIDRPIFNKEVKTAFVFSGGGIRGSWQWDLYDPLHKHFNVDSCQGTSTGSLTALAAALGIPYEYLAAIFERECRTNARGIFAPGVMELKDGKLKKKLSFYWNLATNLDKMAGLMKIDPLIKTIEQILTEFPAWKCKYFFYVVDLHTGNKLAFCPDDFFTLSELARGIAASCAIPGLVEPIRDLKTKKGIFKCCVDGGTREGFPLSLAFDNMDKTVQNQIVGLSCNVKEMMPAEDLQGILNIVGAAAYNGMNEMMLGDIDSAQLMNLLVKQDAAIAADKADVPISLIYYKGGRGVLEFTPEARIDMKKTAKDDYQRIISLAA